MTSIPILPRTVLSLERPWVWQYPQYSTNSYQTVEMTYIYTSINEASLDSDNGLSSEWLRAIIWFKEFVKKWSYRSKLKSNLNGNMAISLKENDDHKMAVILSWPQCVDTNEMLLEYISSGVEACLPTSNHRYTLDKYKQNLHQQSFTNQIKLKQFFKIAVISSWPQRVDADGTSLKCISNGATFPHMKSTIFTW